MSQIQIFASFDLDHDRELFDLLVAYSEAPGSSFTVSGGSTRSSDSDASQEKLRRQIHEADQMIVICGEYSEASVAMSAELRIAQEEGTPHFLLWGRRDVMCTKPAGAKPSEGMYRWTRQLLSDQISITRRHARTDEAAHAMRNPSRS